MHFSYPMVLATALASSSNPGHSIEADLRRPTTTTSPQWSLEGAYLWRGFRHSGAVVGAQLELGPLARHRFALGLVAGVMHKRGHQTSIMAYPRIGYRYNGRSGFTFGLYAGAGYGHRILPTRIYERQGSRVVRNRDRGRSVLVTSGELEFGWNLKPRTGVPLTLYVRPQVLGHSPVNRTISLHIGGQVGVSYAF